MIYPEWESFVGVGQTRADALAAEWETSFVFVAECERDNPDAVATYAALDVRKLQRIDGIGHDTASAIVDQLVAQV